MLQLNTWYTIDLAYDIDTLALLIDGVLVGVTAFPWPLPRRGPARAS